MKLDLTDVEVTTINDALELAAKSAQRAQKGRAPQIEAVYAIVERDIRNLQLKLKTTK